MKKMCGNFLRHVHICVTGLKNQVAKHERICKFDEEKTFDTDILRLVCFGCILLSNPTLNFVQKRLIQRNKNGVLMDNKNHQMELDLFSRIIF